MAKKTKKKTKKATKKTKKTKRVPVIAPAPPELSDDLNPNDSPFEDDNYFDDSLDDLDNEEGMF